MWVDAALGLSCTCAQLLLFQIVHDQSNSHASPFMHFEAIARHACTQMQMWTACHIQSVIARGCMHFVQDGGHTG